LKLASGTPVAIVQSIHLFSSNSLQIMVRTKVFVGNLSFQTKEAELATEFAVLEK